MASPRRNSQATKARLLEAAKEAFAAGSYDEVGLREIARRAEVDVALIGRYFGSKEGIYTEVMRKMMDPSALLNGERSTFGQRIAAALMSDQSDGAGLDTVFIIIRAATSPSALPVLQNISYECFTKPFAKWLSGENAELRAHFIATAMFGAKLAKLTDQQVRSSKSVRKTYESSLAIWIQNLVDGSDPIAGIKEVLES